MNSNRSKYGTIQNRGRRLSAFLLCTVYILSILKYIPISFAASPPQSFYNDLVKIHEKKSVSSIWTYEEFVNRINEIANETLSKAYNDYNQWINPYIYENYYGVVVYGLPHGKSSDGTTDDDFYYTNKGRMFNLKNGKQGEYRYLGYNVNGNSVTNDSWFNPAYGEGRYSSDEDYRKRTYDEIKGAKDSWLKLDPYARDYLLKTKFRDDDFVGGNKEPTPYSLLDIWKDTEFIYNHALIQVAPGIARSASIFLSINGKHHNTLTIDPIYFDFTGSLSVGDVYTLPAGQDEITIEYDIIAKFEHNKANNYLKDVVFYYVSGRGDSVNKTLSVTQNETTYKVEKIKRTFTRSELSTGVNNVNIQGTIKVNSKYGDYKSQKVDKDIKIIVEESPVPFVTVVMTAKPKEVKFTGNDIPVQLDIAYAISNLKNVSQINNVLLTVEGEGTFSETSTLTGERKLNVTIPKSYMSGYSSRIKSYTAKIKYNLKNGESFEGSATTFVIIYTESIITPTPTPSATPTPTPTPTVAPSVTPSPTPSPTPTPTPVPTNNPPYVMLDYPGTVKAGEIFKVTAKANDADGDPLSYFWDLNNATLATNSTSHKYVWYDKQYIDTIQEIYCEVSDGEDIGADLASILVLDPTVEARINVTGTLKVNRAVYLSDISDTPDKYPISNRQWSIVPVSGGTANYIKIKGSINDEFIGVVFKKAGEYKIKLDVTNQAGYKDSAEMTIKIKEDESPVAEFIAPAEVYRDPEDGNQAHINLIDISYSYDNDIISTREWRYRYDSDNDGDFTDETWNTLNIINSSTYIFKTTNIGRYEISLTVREGFRQETIPEFVSENDYLSNTITKVVEVKNIAPQVGLTLDAKEKVDVVIAVGKTTFSRDEINQKINSILKPALFNKNADAKITIIEGGKYSGKYFYDIYNGFTDWGPEQVTHEGIVGWYQWYGLSDAPVFDAKYGYVFPWSVSNFESGYSHYTYLPATAKITTDGEIIGYTTKEYRETVETRDVVRNGYTTWESRYDVTSYYRERKTTDYRIKNELLYTIIANDGELPNNDRIMKNYYLSIPKDYYDRKEGIVTTRTFTVNLLGHWSIKKEPELITDISEYFKNMPTFRDGAKRYIVYIADDKFTVSSTQKDLIYNGKYYFIGVGTSASSSSLQSIRNYSYLGGTIIEKTDLDSIFEQVTNIIDTNISPSIILKYVLRNEEVSISANYSDYESDPQFGSLRYIYTHNPNYFESGTGIDANAGKYLTTTNLKFDKTGEYEISIQLRDNPKNDERFDKYRLWSSPQSMKIYVHNAPVADFTYKAVRASTSSYPKVNLTFVNTSYDIDHISLPNKGILSENWYYRYEYDTWKEGLPSAINSGEVIYVKLEVMDMEYAWSTCINRISYDDIINDGAVVYGKFRFKQNPVYLSQLSDTITIKDLIEDLSYHEGSQPDMELYPNGHKWTVYKGSSNITSGINARIKSAGAGTYTVTLEACARYKYYYNNGRSWYWVELFSAPYTLTLTVLDTDIYPPTVSITPQQRSWNNTNVAVNITTTDTGNSGLKEIRYLWTYNPNFADAEFKVSTTDKLTLTNSQEGTWYLYAQAIDNASNASPIVKGGPYQIDKTAPTLLDFSVTGEDYKNGNIFWIGKNKTIDVKIKSQELLSGMHYTYIRVLQGDNRALHDWTGNSTNLNEFSTSSYTDIIAAERTLIHSENGVYEVSFSLKGLNDIVSSLQYYFTDMVGNTRGYDDSGYYIGVDTIAPVIYATPNQRDITKNTVVVGVSVTDTGSGVKNSKYIVTTSTNKPAAGDSWTTVYEDNFTVDISGTGTWYLYIESRDNVGNVSDLKVGPFKVDMDGPVISAVPVNRIWDNEDASITITVTEGYSALKEVRYNITKTTDRVYTGWQQKNSSGVNYITITEDGSWYLHVEAEDSVGNVSYTYFGPYQVDRQIPNLTMGYVGGARHISGNNYYARQGDIVTYWMQGVDALSGMWRLFAIARDGSTDPYRAAVKDNTFPTYGTHSRVRINTPTITVNNGNTLKANFPYEILTSGDYTFEIEGIADDNATFNRHGWVDTGLRLISDNTPPTISYDQPSGLLMGNDIVVNVSALDNAIGSGVANIAYALSRSSSIPSTGWTVVNSDIASVTFPEEGYWYVHVRATDNVGNVSFANRLYEIIFNTPPTITILGTDPQVIYEGDTISAIIEVDDLQLQPLTLEVFLKDNDGSVIWSGSQIVNPVGNSYPIVKISMINSISPGRYTVYAKATDTYGDTDTDDFAFSVLELSIDGFVNHTDLWDSNRQDYNLKKSGHIDQPRPPEMFWSGEKFVLKALTTTIDPLSDVYAEKVYVNILGYSYNTELFSADGFTWEGILWDESMVNKWGNSDPEYLTFRFTVLYSNGTVKTDAVKIIVDNRDSYYKLHQIW